MHFKTILTLLVFFIFQLKYVENQSLNLLHYILIDIKIIK